ncbi:hypothetical protein TNCV_791541 [Trichonephila clavipes]|nr:hypothetical protein TNCV_791541 [Trichonephila clavipes]
MDSPGTSPPTTHLLITGEADPLSCHIQKAFDRVWTDLCIRLSNIGGPIRARLAPLNLLFLWKRRLCYDGRYGIIGQIFNVPLDVDAMVQQLPLQLNDDQPFIQTCRRT